MVIDLKTILSYILIFFIQVMADCFLDLGVYVHICILPLIIAAFPYKWNPAWVTIASFIVGLAADAMSGGVMGANAGAAALAGWLRNPVYRKMIANDSALPSTTPSVAATGMIQYIKFITIILLLYIVAYTLLDCPALRPFHFLLLKTVASTALSATICTLLSKVMSSKL